MAWKPVLGEIYVLHSLFMLMSIIQKYTLKYTSPQRV
jgi:hypothetical protein